MGYDVAVFGTLALPATAAAAWKKLDATPSRRSAWPAGFGVPVPTRGSVGAIVKRLAKPPPQAWGWQLDATARRVAIRGVMPDDCWLDHARLIAQLWLRGGEVGATGTLSFRGFETAGTAWIVEVGKTRRVRAMTKAERAAADASREMARLHAAAAELIAESRVPRRTAKRPPKLGAIIHDEAAAQRDRAAALAELAVVDPSTAEAVVFAWLEHDDWWEDPKHYALPRAAIEAAIAIGRTSCFERLARMYLTNVSMTGWVCKQLAGASRSPAAAIIATLTDDAFRDDVARATDLLGVLEQRREIGDRARIEAIARGVDAIVARCDLPALVKAAWVKRIAAVAARLLALR